MNETSPPSDEQTLVQEDAWTAPLPDAARLGVGEALRQRRERLGWSLESVSAWLRISEEYLRAFEDNRSDLLPAGIYALGFLRGYAKGLGFSPEAMVALYRRDVRSRLRTPELVFPEPKPERTLPASVVVITGLVVVVASYVGWYRYVGTDPMPVQKIPSVASVIPGIKDATTPSPQVASVMPSSGPSVPGPAAGNDPERQQKIASAADAALSGVPEPSPDAALGSGVSQQDGSSADVSSSGGTDGLPAGGAPPGPSEQAAPSPLPPSGPPKLGLKAIGTTWVQVRAADGHVAYEHTFQDGDTWALPDEGGPFTLTVGNAGGLEVTDGTLISPPLGRTGAVRRNVQVTAESLRDGTLAGMPSVQSVSDSPSAPSLPSVPAVTDPVTGAVLSPSPDEGAPPHADPAPAFRPKKKPAKVRREMSADDLNARQLDRFHNP
ncbi:DUF4115 domain-containing protein [Acetobacter sp. AN02]|uniref:helix-turn-helix domain-containing protein n=1 Tax=Acetobacter sp. AN02 TaxID=2894186 RepID=UPI00243449BB|nr:helix-turn-helix domain-containing protein [Acetobacter sp. AN02]MDG6093511.1 DUF4115 domain-containing protein [Acetobacter sp. AN02]